MKHDVALVPAHDEHLHHAVLAKALLDAAAPQEDGLRIWVHPPHLMRDEDSQPVVVAPSTARGLEHACAVIGAWRPDLPPPALLIVRDAPLPPPPTVVQRTRSLAGRVCLSTEVDYLPQARLVQDYAQALDGRGWRLARARRRLVAVRRRLYVAAAWSHPAAPERAPVPRLALAPHFPDPAVYPYDPAQHVMRNQRGA